MLPPLPIILDRPVLIVMVNYKGLKKLHYVGDRKTIQALNENNVYVTIEINNPLYKDCISGKFGKICQSEQEHDDNNIKAQKKVKCSRLQAKVILHQYNLLEQVEKLVEESDFIVKLAWKEAHIFERDSVIIEALRDRLRWGDGEMVSDADISKLFNEAALLKF